MEKIYCGGFYVEDGAMEIRDGKKYLKTGGSDAVVENAKETGGFGWTEESPKTIIASETIELIDDGSGEPTPKMFENYFEIIPNQSYDIKINGIEYKNITAYANQGAVALEVISGKMFVVSNPTVEESMFASFEAGTFDVEVSQQSVTVHKIDNRYIDPKTTVFYIDSDQNSGKLYLDTNREVEVSWVTFNETYHNAVVLIDPAYSTVYFPVSGVNGNPWGYYIAKPDMSGTKFYGHTILPT